MLKPLLFFGIVVNINAMLTFLTYLFIILFSLVLGCLIPPIVLFVQEKNYINISHNYCKKCGRRLKFYEHIPIFAYIFFGNSCDFCKERFKIKYPLVAIVNTVLYVFCYLFYGFSFSGILLSLTFSLLIILLLVYGQSKKLPTNVLIAFVALSLISLIPASHKLLPIIDKLWALLLATIITALLYFALKLKLKEGIFLLSLSLILGTVGFLINITLAILLNFIVIIFGKKIPSLRDNGYLNILSLVIFCTFFTSFLTQII